MIHVNQVHKSYKNFVALSEVNLSISKGEIYALLGPNGAGKTTTINLILGFWSLIQAVLLLMKFNHQKTLQKQERKWHTFLRT